MSQIEWTDQTWNPVVGCSIISPGCTNCYAMGMAKRLEAMHCHKYDGLTRQSGGRTVWTGEVRCIDAELEKPLHWKKPRMIFVNSMSDLFHEDVPYSFISKIWDIMWQTPQHTYQILTKRPDLMQRALNAMKLPMLHNIWLGVSVEGREYLNRIKILTSIPAKIRFVSFEPLLKSVGTPDLRGIDWVIVGGESGPNSRPIHKVWVEDIKLSCNRNGIAFFFKQWGGKNKKKTGRLLNGRTYDEMPPFNKNVKTLNFKKAVVG